MKKQKERKVSIGGQAVLEGVMMRGASSMATCVRDQDGIIRIESKKIKPAKERSFFSKLPIVRGIFAFVSSLVGGTKVLMRSAEVYGEGEPSKFEKWVSKTLKIDIMSVVITFSLILGLALAVFLFMWLPQTLRGLIESWVGEGYSFGVWAKNFIEGGIKLFVFITYILLCSLLKDIRRTFMYHGAEHKTISCYEKGLELTTANAKKCPRVHDRCGTTFLVFVMLISILSFAVFEALAGEPLLNALGKGPLFNVVRILCKLAILPIVAGLSYELLKGLSKTDCFIFYPLKVPGLLLQRITTKEPTEEMLEVAILAFKTVIEMDNDSTIEEKKFVVPEKRSEVTKKVIERLEQNGITEQAEAEWIVSLTLNIKRDEVYADKLVSPKDIDKINMLTDERISGKPLWYCVGDTDFYGYTIKVDERVLIPRPETELLVENALKEIKDVDRVLDLCTGSGAIAIAIKKESNAHVTASDVSEGALEVAIENAKMHSADIEFIKSDMFSSFSESDKFDVIVSNPPYIKKGDIEGLQKEVKDFEPHLALDGGEDGYDFYRIIAKNAKDHLNKGGVLLLECGINQAQTICSMLDGFSEVLVIKDYENIERIVKAVL